MRPDRPSPSPFDLTGRVAVVTGSSGGIGASIAVSLAEAGADVIGVSRGGRPEAPVRDAIETLGRSYTTLTADLAQRNEVRELATELSRHQVDILVNNAGLIRRAPAEAFGEQLWDSVLDVDLSAPFILAREVGSTMIARGSGKVIFIASMQSFQGGTNIVGYAAAKSGILGVVRALSNEWASRGVNVNAIAPGYIETAMTEARSADPIARSKITDRIPAGRWGTPSDLAGAAVFLAAPASDYVHGAVLPVDGGWLVR